MSVFEVSSLESGEDLTDEELSVEYDDFFDEEDFRAIGINPGCPTPAKPGSEAKVVMLAARYASGLPLWHGSDRYDHGPDAPVADGARTFFSMANNEDDE
jgi:hypothetical protein